MNRQHRGFSLVETLLVLVVLGLLIVAGLVVVRHKGQTTPQASPVSVSSASAMRGAALGIDTPTDNDTNAIQEIGHTPAIIDDFIGWKENGSYNAFPANFVDSISKLHSMPMITWQPGQAITGNQTSSVLTAITSGTQDSYIRAWAIAAKADQHPLYIRFMHEMNGSWYAWGHGVNGNTPAMYVSAFQHVVQIFQQVQANNVQFIWCVSTSTANASSSKVDSNISSYFPGDAYTAWIAMDGYNRSSTMPKSFAAIFGSTYSTLTSISKRPVMIPETATVEDTQDPNAKASWITTSFLHTLPTQFPKVKAVLYFDSKGNGYTYPIDTSPATLAAIQKIFADPYYQTPAPTTLLSY